MSTKIINGDCLTELDKIEENSIDDIITDPPYELNFMNKSWDSCGISFDKNTWSKCLRVLKPGGYLLAFGGSKTFHRIACAIEDAGFEIRDTIIWLYGSGFPKSMNIGLALDKKNGVKSKIIGTQTKGSRPLAGNHNGSWCDNQKDGTFEIKEAQNEWKGWGTCLKPSYEPIIVARKPFRGNLVDNVLKYGVGGINIAECRVETNDDLNGGAYRGKDTKQRENATSYYIKSPKLDGKKYEAPIGRFPANTILTYDETDFDEVCGGFPNIGGSASRYFYCAKASKKDRDEGLDEFEQDITDDGRNKPIDNPYLRGKTMRHNTHPTVKPTALMQYLVRLVSPKGAIILDPFMGSGSTGKAVAYENKERNMEYKFIGIEKDPEYCKIAEARLAFRK